MSKESVQFVGIVREVKIVMLRRYCRMCSRIAKHSSIHNGIEEILTCRECSYAERFNTR